MMEKRVMDDWIMDEWDSAGTMNDWISGLMGHGKDGG